MLCTTQFEVCPLRGDLVQKSQRMLQDLKISFRYYHGMCSVMLIWRTGEKKNQTEWKKRNKIDGNKISGKHSVAAVTLCWIDILKCFHFCQFYLPLFKRPGPQFGSGSYQSLFLDNFKRKFYYAYGDMNFAGLCIRKRKIQVDITDKVDST